MVQKQGTEQNGHVALPPDVNCSEVILVKGAEETKVALICKDLEKPPAPDASSTGTDDSEDSPKRETWARNIDFLLACIGFSVGLGNVWRFPYLCYKNGGGAFLIPYFICVILGGIPVFFLEVALGQFMSVGGIGAWAICPLFQGIGFATTVIVFLLNIYYNVILAWAFYYLFSSFTSTLPWSHCNNPWNTPQCVVSRVQEYTNSTGANITTVFVTSLERFNTSNLTSHTASGFDPVTEFWERKVLQISSGINDVGTIKWDLALCLLLAWVVVYLCIWKGIKTSGKVMYFTATSPYLLMTILLIRGVTLPGAIEGIKFYLIPNWSKLADPQVWVDAGTQIFFSYSISLGTLTALGSYNQFHHNCWKDSALFAMCNSGTSLFAGLVIFSVLGFMAKEQGVSVGDVAESGPGLAFIAYPKAVSQMPFSPFWSILFFFMIILLGLDSQFVGVEGLVTAIVDQFPRTLRKGYRKEIFIGLVCIVSFFVGLTMVTNGGMYVFQLFDYYSGSRIILVVAFFECLVVGWLYDSLKAVAMAAAVATVALLCFGAERFYENLRMMLGFRINPYIKYSWLFTTPLFTLVMFGMCIYSYSELTYNRTYLYPRWAIVFGWMLACSSVVFIPIVAIWKYIRADGTPQQRFAYLMTAKLKPHQMIDEALGNRCSSLNQTPEDAKKADPVETIPLNSDGPGTQVDCVQTKTTSAANGDAPHINGGMTNQNGSVTNQNGYATHQNGSANFTVSGPVQRENAKNSANGPDQV